MKARRMSQRTSVAPSHRGSDRIYLHLFSAKRPPLAVPSGLSGTAFEPPTDVYETDSQVVVRMEIAGADSSRMQVHFDPPAGQLRVRGYRGDPTAGKQREYHQLEVVYGPFERVLEVLVPVEEDRIRADYRDGLLHIYLPKKKPPPPKVLSVDIE
jgi:HSP20 family protein